MENGTDKGKNRAIKIEEGRRKQDKVILSRCCALPQKSIQRDRNFPRMPRTMKVYTTWLQGRFNWKRQSVWQPPISLSIESWCKKWRNCLFVKCLKSVLKIKFELYRDNFHNLSNDGVNPPPPQKKTPPNYM